VMACWTGAGGIRRTVVAQLIKWLSGRPAA
jgi:hypothetical protein